MNSRACHRAPRVAALLCAGLVGFAQLLHAQGREPDEQARFLEVRRRQVELKAERSKLARAKELSVQGLIPKSQLEAVQVDVDTAQLNYQEAVLSLVSMTPRITVRRAIKLQGADGRKSVRLVVANLTPTFDDSQFRLLNNFDGADPIPEELRRREVHDIFISLRDTGDPVPGRSTSEEAGTAIALPYEVHIDHLNYGESRTLDFQLLRDVDSVMIVTSYKGQERRISVQLEQAGSADSVSVSSTQISQEADLGSQADFDLRIERSSVDVRSFELRVFGLPHQIAYNFVDPVSQARLSEINFPAGVSEQNLTLRLYLPDVSDERVRIDQPLDLQVVVMSPEQARVLGDAADPTAEEIDKSHAGHVRLQVTPRGVGRIEVSAVSLSAEIERGETVETPLTVRNTGTRRLDNIQFRAQSPPDWQSQIVPAVLPSLDVGQEEKVALRIAPPRDVPVGDYEVRIKTDSRAYNRPVPSEDKVYRVSVKAGNRLWLTLSMMLAFLGVAAGVIYYGTKFSRR